MDSRRTSPLPGEGAIATVKRALVGPPIPTGEAHHHRLPKVLALSTFSSDALSSVAYATEEMLRVLLPAVGAAAFALILPLSLGIVAVLGILILSYRQTIRAYPSAGGAYIVTRDNFGILPAQVAGVALLIDYVLTVSVSVAAGVAAVVSAAPALHRYRVALALGFVAVIAWGNLRGVKESGRLFAVPTYAFIASVFLVLGMGAWKLVTGRLSAPAPFPHPQPSVGAFLLLHAFATGSTAMTGVEAISNGVPAFRPPEWRNARTTLTAMGALLAAMFLGLTLLTARLHVAPTQTQTLLARLARTVLGPGPLGHGLFLVVQAATTLILVLAANTSFADFPRLASFIAADRFLPSQLTRVGERLVFSNGITALALLSSLLIVAFGASVERLIPLYAVGVFTAFTFSQAGMATHHLRRRAPGWRAGFAINASGAAATAVVLAVVVVTKFTRGAWLVVGAIPFLVWTLTRIRHHYDDVGRTLRDPARRPAADPPPQHVILAVGRPGEADRYAAFYAAAMAPAGFRAVHVGPGDYRTLCAEWSRYPCCSTLEVLPLRSGLAADLRAYLRQVRRQVGPDGVLNVLIPETVVAPGPRHPLRRPTVQLLKAALLGEPGTVVTNVTYRPGALRLPHDPAAVKHVVVVLVSAAHNATLLALRHARSMRPHRLHCVHVEVNPEHTRRVVQAWEAAAPGVALEVLESPFRQVSGPVVRWVRELIRDVPGAMVTVVVPEFVVQRWWHNLLHNQTALLLKWAFLFEPAVAVASVPYPLRVEDGGAQAGGWKR